MFMYIIIHKHTSSSFGAQAQALIKDITKRTNHFVPPSLFHESSWATSSISSFLRSAQKQALSRRSASASLWPAAPSSPPCRAAVRLDGSVCAMKKTSRGCTIGAHAQTAAAASSSRSPCRSSQPSACSPSTSVTRGLSCMASTTGASGAGWERTHTSRCSTTHASPPISSHNLPLRSKP